MRLRIAADQLGNSDGKWYAGALAAVALGVAGSQGCGNSSSRTTNTAGMDAVALCPLAVAAADAGGQCLCPSATNLLLEPGFDTDVSDWQQNGGANFSSTDATGCPLSGSLQVMVDPIGGSQAVMNAPCVPVTPGQKYDFGGKVLLPTPDPSTGASMAVEWIEYADCHGSFTTTSGPAVDPVSAGSWQSLSSSAVAPNTAAAAFLVLTVTTPQGVSSSALFDDVYFTPSPGAF
jgi:hypothetical protein